jgi:hypothetical protein
VGIVVQRDDEREMMVKENDGDGWSSDDVMRGGKMEMRLSGAESGQG